MRCLMEWEPSDKRSEIPRKGREQRNSLTVNTLVTIHRTVTLSHVAFKARAYCVEKGQGVGSTKEINKIMNKAQSLISSCL